jgi:hypothetical protein
LRKVIGIAIHLAGVLRDDYLIARLEVALADISTQCYSVSGQSWNKPERFICREIALRYFRSFSFIKWSGSYFLHS